MRAVIKPKERMEQLAKKINGELVISRRGVPYIIWDDYSICYFGRGGFWRVFYPSPKAKVYRLEQLRWDFVDIFEFINQVKTVNRMVSDGQLNLIS